MNKSIRELSEELEEYAEIEGSEVGEYWSALCQFSNKADAMSDEFAAALIKELQGVLLDIKTNYQVVENKYTKEVVYKELEYLG